MQRGQWRSQGSAAAVAAALIISFVAVAAADALGDDGEFASLPAAARSLLLAPGNASLAPESDWGLMLEGHSGVWLGPSPQQLSLPLLTSTRTLQATPPDVDSSQLGCLKCELDRIVSKLGNFELSFEEIVITEYSAGITVHKGQPVGLFERGIVEKLHKLYDQRIVDKRITNKHTGRNLLNWAVSTSLEDYRMFRMYRSVTTGPRNFDPAAAAACDIEADGNVPDDPCLKGGSLHTTWTPPASNDPRRRVAAVIVYLWWWPADETPDHPLNMLQRNELFVQLAQLQNEGIGSAAGPGASDSARPDAEVVRLMDLWKMGRRARAAKAFDRAVASCTALPQGKPSTEENPVDAPLDLTRIQVCVQERISRVYGAPRGILVAVDWQTRVYNPSGHLNREMKLKMYVKNRDDNGQPVDDVTTVRVIICMLASRWALGLSL